MPVRNDPDPKPSAVSEPNHFRKFWMERWLAAENSYLGKLVLLTPGDHLRELFETHSNTGGEKIRRKKTVHTAPVALRQNIYVHRGQSAGRQFLNRAV